VCPAPSLGDQTRLAIGPVQPAKAGERVGLHDACVAREEAFGVRATAIGRIEEDGGRRIGAAERAVVADDRPQPALPGLAFRQHRHRRLVGMERAAARTCASIGLVTGCKDAATAPTQSAKVETSRSMPSRAKQALCRFRGRCSPYLPNTTSASSGRHIDDWD
jgi:hypothetical protein